MRRLAAIELALTLIAQPNSARWVSLMPLPSGVTTLLEVAVRDSQAIRTATLACPRSPHLLVEASGFFIEQVMLAESADSYRILGCRGDETHKQLRRHMALLLKWLHPDQVIVPTHDLRIDRTVFARRVTKAWEDVKTADRRAAYDRRIMEGTAPETGFRMSHSTLLPGSSTRPPFQCAAARRRRIHTLDIDVTDTEAVYGLLFTIFRKEA